uniref:Uncharacterized protein n=1 Tax=Musa acuminata subsp. malaccensis TaxID=214687 RepID=A0A804HPB8_MUSAM
MWIRSRVRFHPDQLGTESTPSLAISLTMSYMK